MVSNGKSLVIKTKTSYYLYPLEKTPLNLILDKNFLIKKIKSSNERIIENKFINFIFIEDDYEINVFFDNMNFNLIGWQTLDIYQNLSITYLTSVLKNQGLAKGLFVIPKQN
jgi:outer membrane lipoprotein-sorting protein